MKLVLAIVQDNDVNMLMDDLVENRFSVTKLSTSGGFLKEGNTTLLLGIEEDRLDKCLEIIEANSKRRKTTTSIINASGQATLFNSLPVEIEIGGATIFILDVEQFIKL